MIGKYCAEICWYETCSKGERFLLLLNSSILATETSRLFSFWIDTESFFPPPHLDTVRKNREITRMELKRVARTQKERRTVALVPRTTTVLPLVHSNRVTIIKLAKLVLAPREYSWRDVPARANQYLLRDKEIRGTCFSNYPSCVILRWITSINEQYVFGVSLFLTRCIHFALVCKHLAFDMVGSEVRTWKKRKI